jgi:MoaA/NifB/PqqE/SkfB family radical SAM enzyme
MGISANLTIDDFCETAKLCRQKAYDEINAGRLQTVTVGRRRLVTPRFYQEWIDLLEREALQRAEAAA